MASAENPVRAEIEIDAPVERVWQILTDVDRYGDWNPFTPRVETSLAIGDPIHLHVRLRGKETGFFSWNWIPSAWISSTATWMPVSRSHSSLLITSGSTFSSRPSVISTLSSLIHR